MTFDLRAVARTYAEVVGGDPTVTRYRNDDESEWVDVFAAVDRPRPGVTTWATLGMSRFDTGFETDDGRSLRVELVGEIGADVDTFGNMLTSCALNLANGDYGLTVDTVFPDIVRQYEPDVTTAHMLLTDVFSFEGLVPVDGDNEVLAFLQAVPVTDDEFAFAREHGVPALTDLLERHDADVLDLDRPSVVAAAAAGDPVAPLYCGRWDPVQLRPVPRLDVDEARRRYAEGPTFSVVLPDPPAEVPSVVLDVDPGAARVLVGFHNAGGALDLTYLYRRRGDRLFLEQIDSFVYADERAATVGDPQLTVPVAYAPANVVRHEQLWFRPDGIGRRVVDDADLPTVEAEDRRGIPVEDHWIDVPEFGDWAAISRYEV